MQVNVARTTSCCPVETSPQNNIYTQMSARLAELKVHYTVKQARRVRKNQQMVQHHPGNDWPHLSTTSARGGNTNNTGSILTVLAEKFWELRAQCFQSGFVINPQPVRLQMKENSPRNKLISEQARVQRIV